MEEKSTAHHQDHTVHMHKVITHTIRERMRLNLDGQANGKDQYQNLFFSFSDAIQRHFKTEAGEGND